MGGEGQRPLGPQSLGWSPCTVLPVPRPTAAGLLTVPVVLVPAAVLPMGLAARLVQMAAVAVEPSISAVAMAEWEVTFQW